MNAGDTVYDIDGREFVFIVDVPGHGVLVEPFYECEDGAAYDVPVVLGRVFAEPPVQKLDKTIAERRLELDAITKELNDTKRELEFGRKQREAALAKVSRESAALRRIADFLDGKITHYVLSQYGHVSILPLTEAFCDCEDSRRSKRSLKLLTLFGNDDGTLSWNLNRYSDGSGSDMKCWPVCSLEEATAKVAELIEIVVATWRGDNSKTYGLDGARKAAAECGLPFPGDAMEWLIGKQRLDAQKQVESRQKDLEESQRKLNELSAKTLTL
jgi:hypothetical protein